MLVTEMLHYREKVFHETRFNNSNSIAQMHYQGGKYKLKIF
jgi:hypothetical protein